MLAQVRALVNQENRSRVSKYSLAATIEGVNVISNKKKKKSTKILGIVC
jgi:ribosomal protein L24